MEAKQETKTGELKYKAFFVGSRIRGTSIANIQLLYQAFNPEDNQINEYSVIHELLYSLFGSVIVYIRWDIQEDLEKKIAKGEQIDKIVVDIENDVPPYFRKERPNLAAVLTGLHARKFGIKALEESVDLDAKLPALELGKWAPYVTALGVLGEQLCYKEKPDNLEYLKKKVKQKLEDGLAKYKIKVEVKVK